MPDPDFDAIETPRLRVRRFRPGDAAALAAYRSDPEVARHQGWEAPYPLAEAERFIAGLAGEAPGTPGSWFQFAAAEKASDELVGDCALRTSGREPRQAELGVSFARSHQGRGLAAEAVAAVLGYAFATLGLHRVFAFTEAANLRAQRLLERLGFRQEGRLRESAGSGEGFVDELLYALLASEWRAR